jgi:hypothetical protein
MASPESGSVVRRSQILECDRAMRLRPGKGRRRKERGRAHGSESPGADDQTAPFKRETPAGSEADK